MEKLFKAPDLSRYSNTEIQQAQNLEFVLHDTIFENIAKVKDAALLEIVKRVEGREFTESDAQNFAFVLPDYMIGTSVSLIIYNGKRAGFITCENTGQTIHIKAVIEC